MRHSFMAKASRRGAKIAMNTVPENFPRTPRPHHAQAYLATGSHNLRQLLTDGVPIAHAVERAIIGIDAVKCSPVAGQSPVRRLRQIQQSGFYPFLKPFGF